MIKVYITDKSSKLTDNLCSAIDKSKTAIVKGVFDRLKKCREALAAQTPDVLLLGLALQDGNGIDFCEEVLQEYPDIKILVLTNDDEYSITKRVMDNGAFGFIQKNALPEELIAGICAVANGKYYIGGKIGKQEDENHVDSPEWLSLLEQEIFKLMEKDNSFCETTEKLIIIVRSVEKYRKLLIMHQLINEKETLSVDTVDEYLKILIEDLLVEGYSNWEIAGKLNINIDTVRVYRMDLILKLGAKNSMMFVKKKTDDITKFTPREMQLMRLIAAGFTNKEIANKLYLAVETIKTSRRELILKSDAKSSMALIMDALRQGLIKLEDIDALLQNDF